jgi:hypothetical protein
MLTFFFTSYTSAANYYAQTQVSFEEVALKFIKVEEKKALRMFLIKKLEGLENKVSLPGVSFNSAQDNYTSTANLTANL